MDLHAMLQAYLIQKLEIYHRDGLDVQEPHHTSSEQLREPGTDESISAGGSGNGAVVHSQRLRH